MSFLEKLPTLRFFLFCMPLKIGAIFSAALSIGTSGGYIVLHEFGFFRHIEDWLRNMLGVLSLFFLIISVALLIEIFMKQNVWIYQIWLYTGMCFLSGVIAAYLALIFRLIVSGKFWIRWSTLPVLPFVTVFFYLFIIVNSYRVEIEEKIIDEPT